MKTLEKQEKKEKSTVKNKKRKSKLSFLFKSTIVALTIFSATILATTNLFENKFNSIPEYLVKDVIVYNKINENNKDLKNYIDKYNYTDEIYQKDLNQFKEDMYLNYKDYLAYNGYTDEVLKTKFLNDLVKEFPAKFLIAMMVNDTPQGIRHKNMISIDYYYKKNGLKYGDKITILKKETKDEEILKNIKENEFMENQLFDMVNYSRKINETFYDGYKKITVDHEDLIAKKILENEKELKELFKVNSALSFVKSKNTQAMIKTKENSDWLNKGYISNGKLITFGNELKSMLNMKNNMIEDENYNLKMELLGFYVLKNQD